MDRAPPSVEEVLEQLRLMKVEKDKAEQRANQAEQQTKQAEQQTKQAEHQTKRAEQRANQAEAKTQSATLEELLEHCHHKLFCHFQVETDKSLTTQGDVTNPTGKICPKRLRAWSQFPKLQQEAFDRYYALLHPKDTFDNAKRIFIDTHSISQTGNVHLKNKKISSEDDLLLFESFAVADMVRHIVSQISEYEELRSALNLDVGASVTFANHANALNAGDVELQVQRPPTTPPPMMTASYDHGGKLTKSDNYCIYQAQGQHRKLAYAVEMKAPHKVTKEILRTGLHDMELSKDVINRTTIPGANDQASLFKYHAERITAAVLTQTYQYMLDTGCEYSCLVTGEAIVFLWVPDHPPGELFYHLAEPGHEVGEGQDFQHNRTTIAQILSFLFMALQKPTRDRDWRNKAKAAAKKWEINVLEILAAIPETLRQSHPGSPAFVPTRFPDDVKRTSAYFTRRLAKDMHRKQLFIQRDDKPTDTPRHDDEDSDSDDQDGPRGKPGKGYPATPTPDPATRQPRRDKQPNWQKSDHNDHYNRAYCTQQCLLGLVRGSLLDAACPHFESHRKHGSTHHSINAEQLCTSLQQQLGRRLAYNCTDLQIYGSRCMVFKVSTAAHGYTFIAKGTIGRFIHHLQHEAQVYTRLRKMQGHNIPVCLGSIDLAKPISDFGGVEIIHMLLLSFGGKRVDDDEVEKPNDLQMQIKGFDKKLHGFGIEHGDLENRNILWNTESQGLMFIDFERAKSVTRTNVLQEIAPNQQLSGRDLSQISTRQKPGTFEIYDEEANPLPRQDYRVPDSRKDDATNQGLTSGLLDSDDDPMIAHLWSDGGEDIVYPLISDGEGNEGLRNIEKQKVITSISSDDEVTLKPSKGSMQLDEDDKENAFPVITAI